MTLSELVAEVGRYTARLPVPANGQVRAIPDERTVRYYAALGLLDRPLEMRGRTAIYGAIHVAQVVAIKRLQHTGKSLAEIQALWPKLDHATLTRMTGVALGDAPARAPFWKARPTQTPRPQSGELHLALAPHLTLVVSLASGRVDVSAADLAALTAAAAPLLTELANRGLTAHPEEDR